MIFACMVGLVLVTWSGPVINCLYGASCGGKAARMLIVCVKAVP